MQKPYVKLTFQTDADAAMFARLALQSSTEKHRLGSVQCGIMLDRIASAASVASNCPRFPEPTKGEKN